MSETPERQRQLDEAAAMGERLADELAAKSAPTFADPVLGPLLAREFIRDAAERDAPLVVADFFRRRKVALDDATRWGEDEQHWMSRPGAVGVLTNLTMAAVPDRG